MSRLEFRLAQALLRIVAALCRLLPVRPNRVVLASPRHTALEGNLAWIFAAMRRRRPDLRYVLLLEPYGYGLRAKLGYLLRTIRGMYHLQTARLVVIDNAYLPVHVGSRRPSTTVVQVWHAVGALKRFGADTSQPLEEPERSFLHRGYDYVVTTSEASREPWARAFRTPFERVLPLGSARTDFFFDRESMDAARAAVLRRYPALAGGRVVLYAPTFRGRGRGKHPGPPIDTARLRAALPADHVLAVKTHPNLAVDPAWTAGFDVVIDPRLEINEVFTATDVLLTDYSSSVFEFALLRRPIVLIVPDLAAYEADPGLYLDMRRDLVGAIATTTDEVIEAVRSSRVDDAAWDAFIARHLGDADGRASDRFVERFLGS